MHVKTRLAYAALMGGRRFGGTLAALVAFAACSSSSAPQPLGDDIGMGSHPTGAGSSEAIPPASTMGYTVKVGSTVPVAPGTRVGYALTATALETYQFRWTGDASVAGDGFREFYGSLWTTGHFTSLTPGCVNSACPLENGDYVSAITQVPGGERIDWDTLASTGWDGFSFSTDTEPLYLDVYIDGARQPNLFYFPQAPGGAVSSPGATPFAISSSK